MGYKKTLIHINKFLGEVHQVYKKQKLSQGEEVFKRIDFKLSADEIINNLKENYFAVGHVCFVKNQKIF